MSASVVDDEVMQCSEVNLADVDVDDDDVFDEGDGDDAVDEGSDCRASVLPFAPFDKALLTQWRSAHAAEMLGEAVQLFSVFETLRCVADTDCSVLVTGESGTGKELVACALHRAGPRSNNPLVIVNCAAIPENLLESELFGHIKGSFTGAMYSRIGKFAAADGGTLVLDEIGDLPLSLQAKLLRAIQQKEITPVGDNRSQHVDVRIIAATNRDLAQMVSDRLFREDLYYRINVIPVELPALRERREDIPLLVKYFIEKTNRVRQRHVTGVSDEVMRILQNYNWPGNIRQLENKIERMVVLRSQGQLRIEDVPKKLLVGHRHVGASADPLLPDCGVDLRDAVERFENALITQALQRARGNKNKAASFLKMNRTTLVEKIKKKGLSDMPASFAGRPWQLAS